MFDFVRKHTKVMQFLLFLLIFPSFVLVGINGYNRFREKGDAVAKVDGHEIMQGDLDNAHKQDVERLREQMPTLDPKLLDSPAARYATLERMVRDQVLGSAAAKSKLTTSDQRLAQELQQNELIRALRGPDGKLDMARYKQLVGARGMSPEMFEAGIRQDLSSRQVMAGIGGTSFATPAEAKVAIDAYLEKREVQVARFDAADFMAKVNPTDADLEAFYKANPAMFQAPEQADIEYVMLDAESIMKSLPVNEQDLKDYYTQNVGSRPAAAEERRASHILIPAPKDAPAAERAKAKSKAEEVLAMAKKAPDNFAELAKKYSQDPGSAAKGGDLDYFTRGAMTKPFEDAVFAMKPGDIAGPVETEFGYHIVKLTDVKAAKQKTFEEMRPELEAEFKKQQAQKKFAELADTFSNGVYEQADSLKPVADRLKLEVKTAANVQRTPAPGNKGPLGNPKFLSALFSTDSIEKKRNTEAVEIAPNTLVSGRVVKYTPARTLPLAEVKDRVRERVVAARAAELAKTEGKQKLAAWKANPASASLPASVTVSRQDAQKQPSAIVEAALRADPGALPAFAGVDLGDQGYAVVKVDKIVPRDAPAPEMAKQELDQYTKWWASAENLAYYNLLKERFKVKIELPKPAAPELPTQ
jgi:peptidyl-prolyl cis-trans isomerase D